MLRDIRELAGDPEAYAAELNRRWGGLLSYRYLGRSYSSMDIGATDTVPVRHDMRNPTGGLYLAVLGIVSPDSGLVSDLEAVPNPVIHSIQVLDPGRDVRRIEIQSEGSSAAGRWRTAGRRSSTPTTPAGCWHSTRVRGEHRRAAGGPGSDGTQPDRGRRLRPTCRRCGRCSAPADDPTARGHYRS